LFGNLFGSKANAAPSQGQVASAAPGNPSPSHGGLFSGLFSSTRETSDASADATPPETQPAAPVKPKAVARNVSAHPKPTPETNKSETNEADASKTKAAPAPTAPQKEANIAAPPGNNGTLKGAQPVVPSGSFDNRWGNLQ
jgi:hypothetical protein